MLSNGMERNTTGESGHTKSKRRAEKHNNGETIISVKNKEEHE